MEITLTTPAIVFSTVSLIYLAYTNRFVALSNLVRNLKVRYVETRDPSIVPQISNLRRRIELIRNMQLLGIGSLLTSTLSILCLLFDQKHWGAGLFCGSLICLIASMLLAAREILMSVEALNIELSSIEELNASGDDGFDLGDNLKKIANHLLFKHDKTEEEK